VRIPHPASVAAACCVGTVAPAVAEAPGRHQDPGACEGCHCQVGQRKGPLQRLRLSANGAVGVAVCRRLVAVWYLKFSKVVTQWQARARRWLSNRRVKECLAKERAAAMKVMHPSLASIICYDSVYGLRYG
jgi:hypothetical protein